MEGSGPDYSAACGRFARGAPNRIRLRISSNRSSAAVSDVNNETTTAMPNDSGMAMIAGLRNGTNHQLVSISLSALPNRSTCTVGDNRIRTSETIVPVRMLATVAGVVKRRQKIASTSAGKFAAQAIE